MKVASTEKPLCTAVCVDLATIIPDNNVRKRDKSAGADLNSRRLARRAEYTDVFCNLLTLVFGRFQGLKRYPRYCGLPALRPPGRTSCVQNRSGRFCRGYDVNFFFGISCSLNVAMHQIAVIAAWNSTSPLFCGTAVDQTAISLYRLI